LVLVSEGILTDYLEHAMEHARVEKIDENNWHAEIPECDGVWAIAEDAVKASAVLQQVLEEWMVIRLQRGQGLPPVDGVAVDPLPPISDMRA
jgi:predicted RNase H-like HicB family nuclease